MTPQEITQFQSYIYRFLDTYGRPDLPWRQDFEPYKIMISEIMLQQTQVDRVIPKFNNFLKAFPRVSDLATASVADVITQWQGLGYNRRGLNLQRAAQMIISDFNGLVPCSLESLLALPGIGPYTAAAILAFAFNKPSPVVETNIRTVYLHHFFPGVDKISDAELLPLIEATMDHQNPRRWYSALMDYGTHLKKVLPNPSRRSKHYAKQAPLVGSNREVRGKILKVLTENSLVPVSDLPAITNLEPYRLTKALDQLVAEGFVVYKGEAISLKK